MTILNAKNLAKYFWLKNQTSSWDRVQAIYKNFFGLGDSSLDYRVQDKHWALRDINMRIEKGHILGIIGANGAGKSTLLKIIAGVMKPDAGEIKVDCVPSSLINLNAGINAKLTGRENVDIGASIRGLSGREKSSFIDEVIDFSELYEFIDEPVANYSSGMKARIGFAMCVAQKPELMLIDEALSVGDRNFSKKCLDHMIAARSNGLSAIFVSHNMTQVMQFCDECIYLENGTVKTFGTPSEVVPCYLEDMQNKANRKKAEQEKAEAAEPAENGDGGKVEVSGQRKDGNMPNGGTGEELDSIEPLRKISIATGFSDEISNQRSLRFYNLPAGKELVETALGVEYLGFEKLNSLKVSLSSAEDQVSDEGILELSSHSPLSLAVRFELKQMIPSVDLSLNILSAGGQLMTTAATLGQTHFDRKKNIKKAVVEVEIEKLNLPPATYHIYVAIHESAAYLWRGYLAKLVVRQDGNMYWGLYAPKYTAQIDQIG